MKKLAAILVLFCVLMCSCGAVPKDSAITDGDNPTESKPVKIETDLSEPLILSNSIYCPTLNGMFFVDYIQSAQYAGDKLNFMDFDTMQSAAICSKPNCKHDDPSVCSAFGISNHPTLFGNTLFYFTNENAFDEKTGAFKITSELWQADKDGSSRKKLHSLDCSFNSVDTAAVKGNKLYFVGSKSADINNSAEDDCCNLYYFDMTKKELVECGQLSKGFDCSANILGEYDGKMYLLTAYSSGKFESKVFTDEYFAMTPDEQAELREKESEEMTKLRIVEYLKLDYSTGSLEKVDIPAKQDSVFVGGGCLFYVDKDSGENILCYESKTTVVDCCLTYGKAVDSIVFMMNTLTAFDLTNMQTLKLSEAVIDRGDVILDCRNSGYIVKNAMSGEYRTVSENEMFEK